MLRTSPSGVTTTSGKKHHRHHSSRRSKHSHHQNASCDQKQGQQKDDHQRQPPVPPLPLMYQSFGSSYGVHSVSTAGGQLSHSHQHQVQEQSAHTMCHQANSTMSNVPAGSSSIPPQVQGGGGIIHQPPAPAPPPPPLYPHLAAMAAMSTTYPDPYSRSLSFLAPYTPNSNSIPGANPDGTANFFPFEPDTSSTLPPQSAALASLGLGWGFDPFVRDSNRMYGISPSDIDKYSRVVFPVCFVCFNLMYWVIYMHIR